MARRTKRLTARNVSTVTKIGRLADGENLYLRVSKSGSTLSKRWVFFYTINGKQREMGLGSVAAVTLASARGKAAEYRSLLQRGVVTRSTRKRPTRRRGLAKFWAPNGLRSILLSRFGQSRRTG